MSRKLEDPKELGARLCILARRVRDLRATVNTYTAALEKAKIEQAASEAELLELVVKWSPIWKSPFHDVGNLVGPPDDKCTDPEGCQWRMP